MSSIKHIIFDFGNILINLDFEETTRRFVQIVGPKIAAIAREKMYAEGIFYAIERGKMDEKSFFEAFRRCSGVADLADEQIRHAWNGMLLDIPAQRIELLKNLRNEGYGIYMLSNINHTHATYIHEYLERVHGISESEWRAHFDVMYYSHEIGERKPDEASFLHVLNDAGLKAEECLFIDDLAENTAVAQQLGIQVYTHTPTEDICNIIPTLLN